MPGGVAGRRDDAHAGRDLGLAVDQLEQPRFAERTDVLWQVAGAVALVRVGRVLPLAPLHDVARLAKQRLDAARRRPARRPTAVVEVQVGHDHRVDVVGLEPDLLQRHADRAVVVDAVDLLQLGRELVAVPGLDQHAPVTDLDQQAARAVLAAVERVARDQLRPERLRHDPVHGATVEAEAAALERGQPRVTEREHAAILPHERPAQTLGADAN